MLEGVECEEAVEKWVKQREITGAADLAAAAASVCFSYFDGEVTNAELWECPPTPCVVFLAGEGSEEGEDWKLGAMMRVAQNWLAFAAEEVRDLFAFGYGDKKAPHGVFFVCPCCAWPRLERPPVVGRKAVCPCCGLEFDTAPRVREDLPFYAHYAAWIEAGAPFRQRDQRPTPWNALWQLEAVRMELLPEDRERIQRGGEQPVLQAMSGGTSPAPWPVWDELGLPAVPALGWDAIQAHQREAAQQAAK